MSKGRTVWFIFDDDAEAPVVATIREQRADVVALAPSIERMREVRQRIAYGTLTVDGIEPAPTYPA